jgi:hypothetical protein
MAADPAEVREGAQMKLRRAASFAGAILLGMSAAGGVVAAEDVTTVDVSGTIVGEDGLPIEITTARLYEFETEDSEPIVTDIEVAADGSFTVALRQWGTPEAPARATIWAYAVEEEPVFDEKGCWTISTPYGSIDLEIPGAVPTDPLLIIVDRFAEQGLCPPVTATPAPETPDPVAPGLTLPPTDALAQPTTPGSAMFAWVSVGALFVGSFLGLALLPNRRRSNL